MRRRDLRRSRPVARRQDRPDRVRSETARPDHHEGPDERAHHLMQERVRAERERDQISIASHGDPMEIPNRRPPPPGVTAEGREVVFADEPSAGAAHREYVQGAGTMPNVPGGERIGDVAGRDHV